jgi:uncharacterized protein YbjQ (UPF0145 family)
MGQPMPPPQQFPILISTMNDVPGYRVAHVFGEVFGLTVRSRNVFSNIGAGFKAMAGGELKGLSKLLSDSRNEALGRLVQEAMGRGANAVLAMRFDCNEIAQTASEIAAYGTAVYLVPADGSQQPAAAPPAAAQPPAPPAPPAQPAQPQYPAPEQPQYGGQPQQYPQAQEQPQYGGGQPQEQPPYGGQPQQYGQQPQQQYGGQPQYPAS